jgi:hypothetical protein
MAARAMSMDSRQASRRAGLKASGDRHDRHEQPVHAGFCHLHDIGGVPELRPVHAGIVPRTGAIMAGITFPRTRQASRGPATGKAHGSRTDAAPRWTGTSTNHPRDHKSTAAAMANPRNDKGAQSRLICGDDHPCINRYGRQHGASAASWYGIRTGDIWAGETIGRRSSLPGNWPEEGMLPVVLVTGSGRPAARRAAVPAQCPRARNALRRFAAIKAPGRAVDLDPGGSCTVVTAGHPPGSRELSWA